MHHRRPYAIAPSIGTEPLNLLPLCVSCHDAEHHRMKGNGSVACDVDGRPLDASHPWFDGGRVEKDTGETAEAVTRHQLDSRAFDCVLFGAGLRAAPHLLLFEKLINLAHAQAPGAKLCFNSTPADTAEAVRRWI